MPRGHDYTREEVLSSWREPRGANKRHTPGGVAIINERRGRDMSRYAQFRENQEMHEPRMFGQGPRQASSDQLRFHGVTHTTNQAYENLVNNAFYIVFTEP